MEVFTLPFLTWLIGILAVLIFLYFMSRNNLWLRKYGLTLFLVLWFLGFTLYYIGYFFGGDSGGGLFHAISSLFSAIFSSGRIMLMEIDLKETGQLAEYKSYQAICMTVIFAAMLLLSTTLLSNIGGGVIGRLRLLFLRFFGTRQNLYLIYGLSRETVYLAGDIRRNDRKATILLLQSRSGSKASDTMQTELENDAFQHGVSKLSIVLEKPLSFLPRIVKKCRKQTYLLLLHPTYWKNTSMLQNLCVPNEPRDLSRLHIYVMNEQQKSEDVSGQEYLQSWDIHWVSREELTARQALMLPSFLHIFPAADCHDGRIERELRLAVIGGTDISEVLCRYLSSCVQTAGMNVSIHWFASELPRKAAYFQISCPELSKAAALVLRNEEPGTMDFYKYFSQKENLPDCIFFADECKQENSRLAFRLQEIFRKQYQKQVPLFVHMDNVLEDQDALSASGIYSFGCMEQIFSYEVMIGEKLDALAKGIHLYYKQFYHEIGEKEAFWKSASLYEKRSSRALALHISWKLQCAGISPFDGDAAESFQNALAKNPALLENLSVGEHLRWNASLFSDGWRTASFEDLPSGHSKDSIRKLHVCLIPWEDLPRLKEIYGVDYQYLDRHLVESLPQILLDSIPE